MSEKMEAVATSEAPVALGAYSQALKNIKQILDTAGTGIEHVVRATIYMKNVEDFKEVDARYADVFIGSVKPARVAIGGNDIPKGALVEIDAIAVL